MIFATKMILGAIATFLGILFGMWLHHKGEEMQKKADDEAVWGQD